MRGYTRRELTETDQFASKELIRLREQRGLTRGQAAAGMGIASTSLEAIEERWTDGRDSTLQKVAHFYGIFVLDLMALIRFGQWPVNAEVPGKA